MKRIIYRHQIPLNDTDLTISTSVPSKVVHVGMKQGDVCIWVEQIDPASVGLLLTERTFRVFGTGHPIPEGYHHHGSVVDGGFVWHVYERSLHQRN